MGAYSLLQQTEFWIDRNDVKHRVREMEPCYCANVVRFLERRAVAISSAAYFDMAFIPMPQGGAAADIVEEAMRVEEDRMLSDPLGWLRGTPLLIALNKRAAEVA